jgi:hypothetical protein
MSRYRGDNIGWTIALWVLFFVFIGCAVKKPHSVLVVPPECAKNVQVVGDCPLDANGQIITCPIRVTPTCTKVKEK